MRGECAAGEGDSGSSPGAMQARMELRSGFRYRKLEDWWSFAEGSPPVEV